VQGDGLDLVAEFGQRGGGAGAGEAGPDHQDLEAAPVGRVDQPEVEQVLLPQGADVTGRGRAFDRVPDRPQLIDVGVHGASLCVRPAGGRDRR
jgi:hypothetical protein